MTEEQISAVINSTGATREEALEFLRKNDYDVKKASFAFIQHTAARKKHNEYYAGGSKSGVAVIAPGADESSYEAPQLKKPDPVPAFTGTARTLSSSDIAPPAAPAPPKPSGPFVAKRTDYSAPGKPKTRIRFELPNGQTLMLSVSLDATVADLKSYIVENYPEAEGKPMALNVTVPPKSLTDDTETVEAAGLKMSAIKVVC